MVKILVSGADGQLGNEIKKLAVNFDDLELFYTDISTLDICDYQKLDSFFSNNAFAYIINCAAYTNVDKAESDTENAEKVNIEAVKNLVKISNKYTCKLIHISTDYVFDSCLKNTPFIESDEAIANSVYGSTKLRGELELQAAENYIAIRTSWLYSSFGNNFVKTMLRLGKERSELGVIFDQTGTPTYAHDLAEAILQIIKVSEASKSFKTGIYHYSNEGVCSWYDFAVEIMQSAALNCKIKPIETTDYPLPAKRPAYSVMNKAKIKQSFGLEIPHWTASLKKCLSELGI